MRRTSTARPRGTPARPQPAVRRLADEGAFAGAVLDAGCGTGENALHIASLGLQVLGVDVAETALSIAREKAAARGIDADFVVADAFHLDRLGRVFETVLDCGLLHTFDGDERRAYVASLASVTARGGHVHLLCFSDAGPDTGPTPSRRRSCGRRSHRAAAGASRPFARTGSRPRSPRRVCRPGWRRSSGQPEPQHRGVEYRTARLGTRSGVGSVPSRAHAPMCADLTDHNRAKPSSILERELPSTRPLDGLPAPRCVTRTTGRTASHPGHTERGARPAQHKENDR